MEIRIEGRQRIDKASITRIYEASSSGEVPSTRVVKRQYLQCTVARH